MKQANGAQHQGAFACTETWGLSGSPCPVANWEPLCTIFGPEGSVFLATEVWLSECLGTLEVKSVPPNSPAYLPEDFSLFFLRKPEFTGPGTAPSQWRGYRHTSETLWVLY